MKNHPYIPTLGGWSWRGFVFFSIAILGVPPIGQRDTAVCHVCHVGHARHRQLDTRRVRDRNRLASRYLYPARDRYIRARDSDHLIAGEGAQWDSEVSTGYGDRRLLLC